MRAHLVLKTSLCLLLAASLCSCVDASKDSSSSESSENQTIEEGAQVNQPTVTTVAGGGAQVDASNRPENAAVSDSDELLEGDPCETLLWKPESESDGNLAIISAPGDIIAWSSVEVVRAAEGEDAAEVEFCEYADLTPEGDRQVWRCSNPGAEYTGAFTIEFGGSSCSGEVADPASRND